MLEICPAVAVWMWMPHGINKIERRQPAGTKLPAGFSGSTERTKRAETREER